MQFLSSLRGVVAGALCVFSLAIVPSARAEVTVGSKAPNVTLQNQDGKTVSPPTARAKVGQCYISIPRQALRAARHKLAHSATPSY